MFRTPWRRGAGCFAASTPFAVSAGLWVLLMQVVGRMPPQMLPRTADGLMGLLALILVLYLVAPTAQQLIALSANARLRMPGGRP